ncbi:MAG: hypothetical protein ABI597_07305 [Gammaproteobacteria bacterium]
MLSQYDPIVLEQDNEAPIEIAEVLLTEESPILKQAIQTIKNALGNDNNEQLEFAESANFFDIDISAPIFSHDQALDEVSLLDISVDLAARNIQIEELKTSMLELYVFATTEFLCETEKKHDGIKLDDIVTTLINTRAKLEAEFDFRTKTMNFADISHALQKFKPALLTAKELAKRNVEINTKMLTEINDTRTANAKATLAKIKKSANKTAISSVVEIELEDKSKKISQPHHSFWKSKSTLKNTQAQPKVAREHASFSLSREGDD